MVKEFIVCDLGERREYRRRNSNPYLVGLYDALHHYKWNCPWSNCVNPEAKERQAVKDYNKGYCAGDEMHDLLREKGINPHDVASTLASQMDK